MFSNSQRKVQDRARILRLLSDGVTHSALDIAQKTGVSTRRIRLVIRFMEESLGFKINRSNKGFQLVVNDAGKWPQAVQNTDS